MSIPISEATKRRMLRGLLALHAVTNILNGGLAMWAPAGWKGPTGVEAFFVGADERLVQSLGTALPQTANWGLWLTSPLRFPHPRHRLLRPWRLRSLSSAVSAP